MVNTQKKGIVSSVIDVLTNANNFALIQFEKTTHKDLETLRKDLKKKDAKMQVVKNTLFEKAVNKLSEKSKEYREVRDKHFPLKQKSAVIMFKGDWADALKTYFTTAKDNEAFSFKFGLIENNAYDAEGMKKLAQLPGKDELVAKLLGAMKNPMVRTTQAIKNPMQKFVYVLNAKAKQG